MRRATNLGAAGVGLAAVLLLTTVATASPITVVNTGPGPDENGGAALYNYSGGFQWLAAGFSVAAPVTVTSAEGWIGVSTGGQMTVRLYSDGGDVPGSPLLSVDVLLSEGAADWRGVTGINWLLEPGTYWVSFEPSFGVFGWMPVPSPSPLGKDAFLGLAEPWVPGGGIDMGVRILGETGDPVPEPTSLVLLGTGVLSLGGRLWRRRRG